MADLPQPDAEPEPLPRPLDMRFPGRIRLHVDARDVERRIFNVRETVPVAAGPLALLFPEWLPGYHSPQAPIELFAGLRIFTGDRELRWRRHPVNVHAFSVDVPPGVHEIEARFQFLSPTDPAQGRVTVGRSLLTLQWNAVILYPAGHFARRIEIEPSVTLPDGWRASCALGVEGNGADIVFPPVALDVLVDSPMFAGLYFRRVALDDRGQVHLNLFADDAESLAATPAQIAPHRALVEQADHLFGTRHFDRYEVLLALSDEIGSIGVEHHRSCEAVTVPDYFSNWEGTFSRRETVPHEYVHSWNGKRRRGADSWTPSFDRPIRNSLMWVYEGQTQYWGRVLCARSGLWTRDHALGALALTAATHECQAGSRWRPTSDTTRDPIIAGRAPLPWPSWQRSEDYYSEGALIWLDVDTRIRESSNERRSLDDFAKRFFGDGEEGDWSTRTYTFEDVVACLDGLAEFDWRGFFQEKLEGLHDGAPLAGIERGGYRLVYRDAPSAYLANRERLTGNLMLAFSLGLTVGRDGSLSEVFWNSPAYHAKLTAGSKITRVNGAEFTAHGLSRAVARTRNGIPLELHVRSGTYERQVTIEWMSGHRYPHLMPLAGQRRLDDILQLRR